MTRIGIISDTHGKLHDSMNAVRMLQSLEVETVLHCGDIGTPEVIALFAEWPTHFVFGNCDCDYEILKASIENLPNGVCHGTFGEIEIDGVRIALLHSDNRQKFQQALTGDDYDLVCYGHTHIAAQDTYGKTIALNPGAIHRANPPSIAYLELPNLEPTFVKL